MSIFSKFSFSAPDLGTLKISQFFSSAANKAKSYIPDVITNKAKSAIDLSSAALSAAASGATQYSKYGKLVSGIEFAKDVGFTISNASSAIDAISNKKEAAKWYLLQTAKYASYAAMNYAAVYYADNNYLTAAAIAAPIASYLMPNVIDGITNWAQSKTSPYLPVAPIEVLEKQVEELTRLKEQIKPDDAIEGLRREIAQLNVEIRNLKADEEALRVANQQLIDDLKEHEDPQPKSKKEKAQAQTPQQRQMGVNQAEIRKLNGEINTKDAKIKALEADIRKLTKDKETLNRNAANLRAQLNQLADEEAKQNPDSDLVKKLRRLIRLCEELGPEVMLYFNQRASPGGASAAIRHRRH